MQQTIILVQKIGVNVIALVFDGAPSNITMSNNLYNNLNKLPTHFSVNGSKTYIFYDAHHTIKSVRNML